MLVVAIETVGSERFIRGFNRVAAKTADLTEPFNRIYEDFKESEKVIFDKEGTPEHFKILKPTYSSWKNEHFPGRKIMQLTGALKRAMTRGDIKKIEHDSAEFGTDIVYAHRHQEGTFNMPKRKFVQIRYYQKIKWARIIHEWLIKEFKPLGVEVVNDGNYNGKDSSGPRSYEMSL
jgi:phage gpG-like protein